jgi:release factor glutamine methyltransferase
MNKVAELIYHGKSILKKHHKPESESNYIYMIAASCDKNHIIKNYNQIIDHNIERKFLDLIKQRVSGVPLAYLRGNQEFWGLDFLVNQHTLIPRADSEILVNMVLNKTDKAIQGNILDLGTGSGCLILSILSERKEILGVAVDLSKKSLEIAEQNAINHKLNDRVKFLHQSWNDNISGKFDIIISNPPYIKTDDIANLQEEVKDFEPLHALDGGNDGLLCYKEIISIIPKIANHNCLCAFEIGYHQADEIINLLKLDHFANIELEQDLSGNDRVITFRYI